MPGDDFTNAIAVMLVQSLETAGCFGFSLQSHRPTGVFAAKGIIDRLHQ
jgi:hypothetical protein